MTPERGYMSILTNLSRQAPLDLDAKIFEPVQIAHETPIELSSFPPPTALWNMRGEGPSRIGIRVTEPIENVQFLAARLASIALERQVFPIFLNHLSKSEMHRFGFRVEQISGVDIDARSQFEAQVTRLWRLALIVDASDISRLG